MRIFLDFLMILALLAVCGLAIRDDMEQRAALGETRAQLAAAVAARAASVAGANTRQASCQADVASAVKAGAAIARASAIRGRSNPKVQPLVMAPEIQASIQ